MNKDSCILTFGKIQLKSPNSLVKPASLYISTGNFRLQKIRVRVHQRDQHLAPLAPQSVFPGEAGQDKDTSESWVLVM